MDATGKDPHKLVATGKDPHKLVATGKDPYEFVAAFYEAEFGAAEPDVAFFARRGGSGPLLVLGCGTGRLVRHLEALRPVTGLDRSAPMLEIARRKAPASRFVEGDMRDFRLGTFSEILIPNASFAFLTTRADQQRCLACCRASLAPGGTLSIDLPMPDGALWGTLHTPEKPAWEGTVEGQPARRTREVYRSLARQRLDLIDRYYVEGRLVATSPLALRVMLPGEVEWMLEACGFYLEEAVGDYAGGPLRDGCPRLLARAAVL